MSTLDYDDYDAMVDLSVAADSGLMQRGVEGGESEAREEQVDLGLSLSGMVI